MSWLRAQARCTSRLLPLGAWPAGPGLTTIDVVVARGGAVLVAAGVPKLSMPWTLRGVSIIRGGGVQPACGCQQKWYIKPAVGGSLRALGGHVGGAQVVMARHAKVHVPV